MRRWEGLGPFFPRRKDMKKDPPRRKKTHYGFKIMVKAVGVIKNRSATIKERAPKKKLISLFGKSGMMHY